MTTNQFNQSVTREIQRIMSEAEEKRKAEEWPSVEEQLNYWKEKENDSRTS